MGVRARPDELEGIRGMFGIDRGGDPETKEYAQTQSRSRTEPGVGPEGGNQIGGELTLQEEPSDVGPIGDC